jgi:hypothetical protein
MGMGYNIPSLPPRTVTATQTIGVAHMVPEQVHYPVVMHPDSIAAS